MNKIIINNDAITSAYALLLSLFRHVKTDRKKTAKVVADFIRNHFNYVCIDEAKLAEIIKVSDPYLILWEYEIPMEGLIYNIHPYSYIVVNNNLSDRKKLFVTLHEFAHWLIHNCLYKETKNLSTLLYSDLATNVDYISEDTRKELEANIFALVAMVPDQCIEQSCYSCKDLPHTACKGNQCNVGVRKHEINEDDIREYLKKQLPQSEGFPEEFIELRLKLYLDFDSSFEKAISSELST